MEYNFRYSITDDDFAEFNAYSVWYAPWMKSARISFAVKTAIYCAVGMIASVLVMKGMQRLQKIENLAIIIISAIFLLIITAFSFYQVPYNIKNKARKFINKEENKHILEDGELTVGEDRILSVDKRNSSVYKWDSIVKYAVIKEYFFLYINEANALIIPKRIFVSQEKIDAFDKFLTQKIPLISSFRSM